MTQLSSFMNDEHRQRRVRHRPSGVHAHNRIVPAAAFIVLAILFITLGILGKIPLATEDLQLFSVSAITSGPAERLVASSAGASSCVFNGMTIPHGQSVIALASSITGYGTACPAETRTCTNGTLSGSYEYTHCEAFLAGAPYCVFDIYPGTVNQPSAATLSWYSSGASSFYITHITYVMPNGGASINVAPSATTFYSGYVTNDAGGASTCAATLTVNRSCAFNGSTVTHGASVTAYQAASMPYGSSCVSETRTCSDSALSGSYGYASCTVTAPNCDTPPPLTADGNGYILSAGLSSRWINKFTYSFCVSNSSGLQYFVPTKSSTEVQYFYNAIPGLTGVTQSGL